MTPLEHAQLSVRDFKGGVDDYLELHLFIDSSKLYYPFFMHRMFTHNTFFIGICEKIFGAYLTNSDGVKVAIRRLCEEHIKQDLNGFLPSMQNWVEEYRKAITNKEKSSWMNSPRKKDLEYLQTLK